jgi:glucose-6-phosphate dehydrogenase assembly protein OpcA
MELTDTNASAIAAALLESRRRAGSPAMGMVLTLIVVTDEGDHYDAFRAAQTVSREHPARILGVIRRSARGASKLDAEIKIGDGGSGESVLLRMTGELTRHAESVVLPLLLPDSPVVVWWPRRAPDDPAEDPIGALAQRRITDAATVERGRSTAMLTQARNYTDGNTDLAWTRLTPWRALLAAALDQYPARVRSGVVAAERLNPSADLLMAWLTDRLGVPIERTVSRGPGLTSVTLMTGGGPIEICRPDGLLAEFSIPNAPNRPVALKRRETAELLAEELRRLDPDDIYEDAVHTLCRLADRPASSAKRPAKTPDVKSAAKTAAPKTTAAKTATRKATAAKSTGRKATAAKSTGRKATAAKSSGRKAPAAKQAVRGG